MRRLRLRDLPTVNMDLLPSMFDRLKSRRFVYLYLVVWLRLRCMDYIGEFHRILDEENGDVVPDDVPVPFLGVELDCEAAHITDGIRASSAAEDCRESHEDGRLARGVCQDWSKSDIRGALVQCEFAKSARSPGVNYPLGDSLVVKTMDLGDRVSSWTFVFPTKYQ